MDTINGFLIDLDGVLYIDKRVIPGAVETMGWLRRQEFPLRFLTNTTMRSRRSLVRKLRGLGLQAEPHEMFSTAVVAARWLKTQGISRVHLMLTEDAQLDFAGFQITTSHPDAVVVGDMGQDFNYEILNEAFLSVKGGARLIALQKNRFWVTENGLALDAGAFVAALEYATEREAELVGKPNRAYFRMALEDMGIPPSQVAMVGDDLEADIKGAQTVGLKTILVKTGKFQCDAGSSLPVQPDLIIATIADLPRAIQISAK